MRTKLALGLALVGVVACASADGRNSGGSDGGGGSSGGTGGSAGQPSCESVLDCNPSFIAYLNTLPACGSCLQTACSAEVAACGPGGAKCSGSVACYADPIFADLNVIDGTCNMAEPPSFWPFICYLTRPECVAVRSTEPEGLALFQCMLSACETDCGLATAPNCDAPPPCSTVNP